MRELTIKIKDKKRIKDDVFLMDLYAPEIATRAYPGQFIHIKTDDKITILRRPISIHAVNKNVISILFRVKGSGTRALSLLSDGDTLNVLGPLGHGFSLKPRKNDAFVNILIGGGMGVAPLMFLAQKLTNKESNIVILGASDKNSVLCEKEFKTLNCKVHVATDDGSRGAKGSVTDLLLDLFNKDGFQGKANIYACGPEAMFCSINSIIADKKNVNCQISYEQFMGCGTGICCGCTVKTKTGYKKACKDGPVFNIREIW